MYDRFSKDFKDKFKKENAWSKVAETAGLSVEDCIKKYKNIRTNYVRNWKKRKPSGSGRESDNSENSQKCYQWLDTFIEHRKTFTNLPSSFYSVGTTSDAESSVSEFHHLENDSSILQDDMEEGEEDIDSFENVSNITVSSSPEIAPSSMKNKQNCTKRNTSDMRNEQNNRPWAKGSKKVKKCDIDDAFLKTINNFEKSFSSKLAHKYQDDEDLLFCKSLVPQIRRLRPETKGLAKCQILQLLQGFEFGTPLTTPAATTSFCRPSSTANVPYLQDEFGAPSSFHTFNQAVSREFPTYK